MRGVNRIVKQEDFAPFWRDEPRACQPVTGPTTSSLQTAAVHDQIVGRQKQAAERSAATRETTL